MSYSRGSGSASISTSTDVALSNPVTAQVLTYNATTQKWTNSAVAGGLASVEKDILTTGAKTIATSGNSAISKFSGTLSTARTLTLSNGATAGSTIEVSFIDTLFNGFSYSITDGNFTHTFNYPTYVKYVFIGSAWERII